MKISEVLKANKEIRVLNIVKFNKWDNIEISDKYIKLLNYDMNYINYNIDMNMDKKEINNYYIKYIESLSNNSNFDRFIKSLKDIEVQKIDNKSLLKLHCLDDYFNNWNDVKTFILNTVLPEIKGLNIQ